MSQNEGPCVRRSIRGGEHHLLANRISLKGGRQQSYLQGEGGEAAHHFSKASGVTMSEKHSKAQSTHSSRGRTRTGWRYLERVTDNELAAAIARDRDAAPPDIDWSNAVIVVPAKKKAISIRVDPDVLDFFKNEGPGYQRRINAVLRSYVEQKQKRGTSA